MLKSLSIKNYALIDDLHVDFSSGFQIITGETGAGKSILLDALSLVLGNRADLGVLRDKETKCIVEAEFSVSNYDLKPLFETCELDYEPTTIIRREILPSGKSRAFVNDTPSTLSALGQLGEVLVDIHSQHQTLLLSDNRYQFEIIDGVADNKELLKSYSEEFKIYRKANKKLQELIDFQKNAHKEHEYNSYLLNELKEAPLQEGIQEELEEIYDQASNAEEIKERLAESHQLLDDENIGVLNSLSDLKIIFLKLSHYGSQYQNLQERIESVYIELDDFQQEILDIAEDIDSDPKLLEDTHQKLQKIYDLQKKHQVATVEELMQIQQDLEEKVSEVENIEDRISEQQKETEKARKTLEKTAQSLRKNRLSALPKFTKELEAILHDLGMPNARFQIELKPTEDFQNNGKDELSFLFSANKGGRFGELKKVASGGELSRIMLSVKSILAQHIALPTIMFDEIDTGVSGDISQKMAEIMQQMSKNRQVFAITHLPQVASKGSAHYKVFKEDKNDKTTTELVLLTPEQRIEEIAQMLGGKNITESARTHAKELLKN